MNIVYLTDGAPRKVSLGNGRSIPVSYTHLSNEKAVGVKAFLVGILLIEISEACACLRHVGDFHLYTYTLA